MSTHYQSNLAGKDVPLHESDPQPGFYKLRRHKNAAWLPVAIWNAKDGGLVCRVAGEMEDPNEVWTYCCGNPVNKADAKHAFEHGSWPGDIPSVGHNGAPSETLSDKISRIAKDAVEWLRKSGIKDVVSKNMAANYRDLLNGLKKEADAARDAEKRPHLDAGREIDARYRPLIAEADEAAVELRNALTVYMRFEEEAMRAAAKIQRETAEEAARQAKAAAAAKGQPEPEDVPLPLPEPAKVQAGGQRGRKVGLRTVHKVRITDYAKAAEFFINAPEVQEVVQRLASKLVLAGGVVPGTEAYEDKVAA